MGMGCYANYGYVIQLTKELQEKFRLTDEELEDYHDEPGYEEIVLGKITKGMGIPENSIDLILYDRENGDRYDDLEDGYYIMFYEDVLFEKKTTENYRKIMESTGSEPKLSQWVGFG